MLGSIAFMLGSAGRRRPSLLRARKASLRLYSCAVTSSTMGVGGGGGAASFVAVASQE